MIKDLPVIAYNGTVNVSDISAPLKKNTAQTVNYTQGENVRPDMLADKYYNNDRLDRLVLDANDVIDPLQFSVQTYQQINDAAIAMYGSVESAQQHTVYWENNWKDDDSIISPIVYNSMSPRIKQLYDKATNYRGQVTGYTRKQINNRKATDKIIVNGTIHKVIQDDEVPYYSRVSGYDLITQQLTTARENIKLYDKETVTT